MLAVTVELSKFWSSFELPSASKTSVMSNRGLVELLLPSWPPSGTLDNDLARCLSLATALGRERRMLNPGLPAVCKESEPPLPPGTNDRSPWPVPLSSPLAVLAFAPISHAAKYETTYEKPLRTDDDHEILEFVGTRARRTTNDLNTLGRPPSHSTTSIGGNQLH